MSGSPKWQTRPRSDTDTEPCADCGRPIRAGSIIVRYPDASSRCRRCAVAREQRERINTPEAPSVPCTETKSP